MVREDHVASSKRISLISNNQHHMMHGLRLDSTFYMFKLSYSFFSLDGTLLFLSLRCTFPNTTTHHPQRAIRVLPIPMTVPRPPIDFVLRLTMAMIVFTPTTTLSTDVLDGFVVGGSYVGTRANMAMRPNASRPRDSDRQRNDSSGVRASK